MKPFNYQVNSQAHYCLATQISDQVMINVGKQGVHAQIYSQVRHPAFRQVALQVCNRVRNQVRKVNETR